MECIHAYCEDTNEIGERIVFCEVTDSWANITLGDCYGNCEAQEKEATP